jgi:nitric oxide reductase NorD protein
MLEWEEGLFRGGRALVNALWIRPRRKPFLAAEVDLAPLRMELFYFAHLLAGQRLSLFETDEPLLRVGDRLCLPPKCALHIDEKLNRDYYRLKAGLGSLSLREQEALDGLDPGECLGYLTRLLAKEFPGLYEKLQVQKAALPEDFPFELHFGNIRKGSMSTEVQAWNDKDGRDSEGDADSPASNDSITTEIEGKGQTQVEVLAGEDLKAPDVPQHTFEKVETLEEFEGLDRQLDGADDLKEHQEALDELEMRHVIRSKDRASGLYRADILLSPFEMESNSKSPSKGIPYPEWDFRKRDYKPDWCWVQVTDFESRDDSWAESARIKHKARIQALKRKLEQFSTDYLRARAQPSGDEFDLEAVIDARISMRSGSAPSENIYTHRRRDLSDVATLILVDLSDSTDAWVKGEHVLETLRGALFCLGEALEAYTHGFAIAGFASDTRRACRYFPIKDFDTPWSESISKLGSLSPQGYTRMGPAVRHATRILEGRNSRKKAMLLIGDGKPCDYDTYEGRYGIQDVKKAFNEAKDRGILTHAFAVDHRAREYFPAMFSPRSYDVIGEPKDLAEAVFRFFMALKMH